MPTIIQELYVQQGQSVWLDRFNKEWLLNRKLKELIQCGLRGVCLDYQTMHEVIHDTKHYDKAIKLFHTPDGDPLKLCNDLIMDDVRSVADLVAPLYHVTEGGDGFVSVPIDPRLVYDSALLIKEGIRLFKEIRRPNIMFQIPASEEGFLTTEELTAVGINVHVRHVFSFESYKRAQNAYTNGLKRWISTGALARTVNSVVSIDYNRMQKAFAPFILSDSSLGFHLKEFNGDFGIYSCYRILQEYYSYLKSDALRVLKQNGAHPQKLAWGPCFYFPGEARDVRSVEALIANATVTTLDYDTFETFLDEGHMSNGLTQYDNPSDGVFDILKAQGVDHQKICEQLLVSAIAREQSQFSFLLQTLKAKKKW
jgi:transaldolase